MSRKICHSRFGEANQNKLMNYEQALRKQRESLFVQSFRANSRAAKSKMKEILFDLLSILISFRVSGTLYIILVFICNPLLLGLFIQMLFLPPFHFQPQTALHRALCANRRFPGRSRSI